MTEGFDPENNTYWEPGTLVTIKFTIPSRKIYLDDFAIIIGPPEKDLYQCYHIYHQKTAKFLDMNECNLERVPL